MTKDGRRRLESVLQLYKIDGKPALEALAPGQFEIVYNIVYRTHKRVHIMCSTQYGKTRAVALGCNILTSMLGQKVAVVAPTNEKFKILMRYYRDHFKDSPSLEALLEKESKLDRLVMEETAKRITLKNGGIMFGISSQAGNSAKGIESAMGEGAPNIILDEAALTPDMIEATIFRMIAGQGEKGFYCKISNPFYRNHFLKSYEDPEYHKIDINYHQAIKEGRYTTKFINEARKKPLFSILYENKFPTDASYDEGMFLQLISEKRVHVRPDIGMPFLSEAIMGIDPAGEGKNTTRFCIRDQFQAKIVVTMESANPKEIAQRSLNLIEKYKLEARNVVVDSFGVGSDVGKEIALATKGAMNVYTVLIGKQPSAEEEYNKYFFRRRPNEHDKGDDIYMNLRALGFFRMRDWLMKGGVLVDDDGDNSAFKGEVLEIKYKRAVQGNVLQIMSKKDMIARGIQSPDMADAFMLTFLREIEETNQTSEEAREILRQNEEYDPHAAF